MFFTVFDVFICFLKDAKRINFLYDLRTILLMP